MEFIPLTVSIIVPTYNEEKSIISILKTINEQKIIGIKLEIIVVDDGSTDNSVNILKKHSELYSKLIILKKNFGKGGAVKAGLKEARGEYVLIQDADLEYDPTDFTKLFLPVQKFNADIVMGSRLAAPPITRVHYYWNKKGNQCVTSLFNFLNNTTFTDVYSGYLLFRRSLIDPLNLRSNGWEQQAEILTKAVRHGKILYEIPISYYGRTYNEGKKIRPHNVFRIIIMMIREKIFPSD